MDFNLQKHFSDIKCKYLLDFTVTKFSIPVVQCFKSLLHDSLTFLKKFSKRLALPNPQVLCKKTWNGLEWTGMDWNGEDFCKSLIFYVTTKEIKEFLFYRRLSSYDRNSTFCLFNSIPYHSIPLHSIPCFTQCQIRIATLHYIQE